MKSALQDEDNSEDVPRDAKGREILSPEEKTKREDKAKRVAVEVPKFVSAIHTDSHYAPYRKPLRGKNASISSWKSLSAN